MQRTLDKKGEEFLEVMIEVIDDIIISPRWSNNDSPMPNGIIELCARINNGDQYRTIRENPDLTILLEIIENYEESLNDDWLPFNILGLEISEAYSFIKTTRNIVTNYQVHEFEKELRKAYRTINQS